jgi:hypothetical protein
MSTHSYLCDHGYPMGEGCSLCTLSTQQAPEPHVHTDACYGFDHYGERINECGLSEILPMAVPAAQQEESEPRCTTCGRVNDGQPSSCSNSFHLQAPEPREMWSAPFNNPGSDTSHIKAILKSSQQEEMARLIQTVRDADLTIALLNKQIEREHAVHLAKQAKAKEAAVAETVRQAVLICHGERLLRRDQPDLACLAGELGDSIAGLVPTSVIAAIKRRELDQVRAEQIMRKAIEYEVMAENMTASLASQAKLREAHLRELVAWKIYVRHRDSCAALVAGSKACNCGLTQLREAK